MRVKNLLSGSSLVITLLLLFLTGCSDKYQRAVPYENRISFGSDEPSEADVSKKFAPLVVHKWTQRPYTVFGVEYCPEVVPLGTVYEGVASWYGPDFHGNKTSSGEVYNMYGLTAAHKTLPMNTMIKVTNCYNNKSIVVRVNDRGPFVEKRIVDLSYSAGKKIGLDRSGIAPVTLEVLSYDDHIVALLNDEKPQAKTAVALQQAAEVKPAEIQEQAVVTRALEPTDMNVTEQTGAAEIVPANADASSASSVKTAAVQKPEPKPASRKVQGYVVQIGSFSKLDGAQKIKEGAAFVYSGRDVKIVSVLKEEKPVYKVYVSGFGTKEEAKAFVQKNNINGAFITQDD